MGKTELMKLRAIIANDAIAITFQSMAQYRTMLLNFIDSEHQVESPKVIENEQKRKICHNSYAKENSCNDTLIECDSCQ